MSIVFSKSHMDIPLNLFLKWRQGKVWQKKKKTAKPDIASVLEPSLSDTFESSPQASVVSIILHTGAKGGREWRIKWVMKGEGEAGILSEEFIGT